MSATATSTITVWAYTDRGDAPPHVPSYRDLAAVVADALRQGCVGTVLIEVDDVEVARGDSSNTEDLDDYLTALTA